jgi:hypothetical protein
MTATSGMTKRRSAAKGGAVVGLLMIRIAGIEHVCHALRTAETFVTQTRVLPATNHPSGRIVIFVRRLYAV